MENNTIETTSETSSLTPQQQLFLKEYLDPSSKNFGNAYQSGISAGFTHEYSKTITSHNPKWLSENVRSKDMLAKAEMNLMELLSNDKDIRVKADITKFIAERLGKGKYTIRQEIETTEIKRDPDPETDEIIEQIILQRKKLLK